MKMKEFISALQKSRRLSIAELSLLLGYKSPTSVARIVQDKANADSVTRFCQLLKESEDIALTDEEIDQLDRILEKKKLGSVEYAATDMLRLLLRGDPPMEDPLLLGANTGVKQSLLERYMPMEGLRITVLNCETTSIFGALAKLTEAGKAKVDHLLFSDENLLRSVQTIRAVLPILHDSCYEGSTTYCTREEMLGRPRGILLADVMLCEYTLDGRAFYDLVIFQSSGMGMLFTFPGTGDTVHRMMYSLRKGAVPIRNAGMGGLKGDYAAYIRYCADLERDRAVYRIKPDFGMEQIPLHAWQRAFFEGPAADEEIIAPQMEELSRLFDERRNNLLSKKQAQHHVFKQRAVWKFVRTGRLSDQFWAFGNLTMHERLETLTQILEQHTANPYFQVHFLKDEDSMRDDEIVCYDGVGISIIKAGTDYNLDGHHTETMVTQEDFLKIYRSFYLHSILPYMVQPEYKTRKILLEMIEYCRENGG